MTDRTDTPAADFSTPADRAARESLSAPYYFAADDDEVADTMVGGCATPLDALDQYADVCGPDMDDGQTVIVFQMLERLAMQAVCEGIDALTEPVDKPGLKDDLKRSLHDFLTQFQVAEGEPMRYAVEFAFRTEGGKFVRIPVEEPAEGEAGDEQDYGGEFVGMPPLDEAYTPKPLRQPGVRLN